MFYVVHILLFSGIPIKSTLDNNTTVEYAGLISHLVDKARRTTKELDNTNELTFLRVRSKKNEILIAPGKVLFVLLKIFLLIYFQIPDLYFVQNSFMFLQ